MSVIKTWIARGLTATAVAACITMLLTGVTQAYDRGDCVRIFGNDANVAKVDFFSVNGGGADFGDELHLFGAPLGTAVVCFATSGRIAVKGKLYADGSQAALVKIRFRRTNGQFTPNKQRAVTAGLQQSLASYEVVMASPPGHFNRARIRLFTVDFTSGVTALVATRNFDR
jgi:hypothetical protein